MKKTVEISAFLFLLTALICPPSSYARSDKKDKGVLPPCNITVLTQEIGSDASSIVPPELSDFWNIIEIEGKSLIPTVKCLRIDLADRIEFTINRPEDTVSVKSRKAIGTWGTENERKHLLSKLGEQQIGEKFSAKTKAVKNYAELQQIAIEYSKDTGGIFVYAADLKKSNQKISDEIAIGASVGKVFADSDKLMEQLKEQIKADIKANQRELRYTVLYNLKILQPTVRDDKPKLQPEPKKPAEPQPDFQTGENILRFVGSNTLGEKMIPFLSMRFMEEELKAKNIIRHTDSSDNEIIYIIGEIEEKKQHIKITAKGSGEAFKFDSGGLIADVPCDMGMSSRKIKDNEKDSLRQKYGLWEAIHGLKAGEGTEHIIAMDGIAVIVHPSNPIKKLTAETLRKIYSMDITNWKDVNPDTNHGKIGAISVFSRSKPSGTRDFFIEKVKSSERINDAFQEISSSKIAEKVSNDVNAIGFVSESYADSGKVKVADISSTDQIENALPCAREFIRSEEYFFSRPLYLYTIAKPQREELAREFIQFALRKDIQDKIINEEARLISVTGTKYEIVEKNVPQPIPASNANIILRLYGSDTIGENLAIRLAKLYLKENGAKEKDIIINSDKIERTPDGDAPVILVSSNITSEVIEIKPRKSSFGFESLADGTCDIAMSSDAISPRYETLLEKEGLCDKGEMKNPHSQFAVGYDALAIIVNHNNTLRNLSLEQLRLIFTGKVTNWRDVGGEDSPVTVYSRPEGSGTRQFFTRKVLNEAKLTDKATIRLRNPEISEAVVKDRNGIAYLPFSESQGSTLIGIGEGEERYEPNSLTVVTRNLYPIKRTLYFYIPQSEKNLKESQKKNYTHAKKFVRMAQDLNKGQKEVESANFFKILAIQEPSQSEPDQLLVAVYFDFGRAKLETDSENKINNTLITFIQQNSAWQNMKFTVKGYSDIIGAYSRCKTRSDQRAETVAKFLQQKGLSVIKSQGMGISNLHNRSLGISKELLWEDRRAEIWVSR